MKKFNEYFNQWLFEKDGYYSNYKKIGKDGDFFTSVSTSSFFGGSIAKKILKTIEEKNLAKDTTILEIGAHHGYLLADVIQFIYTLNPILLDTLNFAILEPYENLQNSQKKYIKESFGDKIKLKHYKSIEEISLKDAFIFSNEIFDCFSCQLVYTDEENILKEVFIKNHKIFFEKSNDKDLIEHCKKYSIKKGEVSLSYKAFINSLCSNIKNFEFLSFDYGDKYPRNDFSIRIYKEHEVFPFFEKDLELESFFKNSDITYDVHFEYLIDLFKENNIKDISFTTQLKALIDFGILELLEILKANVQENIYLKEAQKIKLLLEPTGMGDRFKVLNVKKYNKN